MTSRGWLSGMFSATQFFVTRSATKTATAQAAMTKRRAPVTLQMLRRTMPSYLAPPGGANELDHAAVDDQDLAGDVARLVRHEEGDGVGDVVDRAEPAERDLPEELVLD